MDLWNVFQTTIMITAKIRCFVLNIRGCSFVSSHRYETRKNYTGSIPSLGIRNPYPPGAWIRSETLYRIGPENPPGYWIFARAFFAHSVSGYQVTTSWK